MACVVSKTVYNLIKRDKGRLNLTAITLLMMPFVSAKATYIVGYLRLLITLNILWLIYTFKLTLIAPIYVLVTRFTFTHFH